MTWVHWTPLRTKGGGRDSRSARRRLRIDGKVRECVKKKILLEESDTRRKEVRHKKGNGGRDKCLSQTCVYGRVPAVALKT